MQVSNVNNIDIQDIIHLGEDSVLNVFGYLKPTDLLSFRTANKTVNYWAMKTITGGKEDNVQKVNRAFKEWLNPYQLFWLLQYGTIGGGNIRLLRNIDPCFFIQADGKLFTAKTSDSGQYTQFLRIERDGFLALDNPTTWTDPSDGQGYCLEYKGDSQAAVTTSLNQVGLKQVRFIELKNGGKREVHEYNNRILLINPENNSNLITLNLTIPAHLVVTSRDYVSYCKKVSPDKYEIYVHSLTDGIELGCLSFDNCHVSKYSINDDEFSVVISTPRLFHTAEISNEIYRFHPQQKFRLLNKHSIIKATKLPNAVNINYKYPRISFQYDKLCVNKFSDVMRDDHHDDLDYRMADEDHNKDVKKIDLSRFGDIVNIQRVKDDIYIHSKEPEPRDGAVRVWIAPQENDIENVFWRKHNDRLYHINLGKPTPPPIEPPPIPPPLTFKQSAFFAARKWIRYSFHNAAFESIAGIILNPNIGRFYLTCVTIVLFLALYPLFVAIDATTLILKFGRVLRGKRDPIDYITKEYDERPYLGRDDIDRLRDENLLYRCRLTNRIITSPARLPGSDALYEETELQSFIMKHGRNPEGNRCTVADIIPDNILRYCIQPI